jgi:hypothetical protein
LDAVSNSVPLVFFSVSQIEWDIDELANS